MLWHWSHGWVVCTWFVGLAVLAIRLPWAWQNSHCLGVPLNTPRAWQVWQLAWACAPVNGKPVVRWLKFALLRSAAGAGAANMSRVNIRPASTARWLVKPDAR